MRREIIFTGSTKEDVAKEFAEIVVGNYVRAVLAHQQMVIDDPSEYKELDQKLKTVPNQLKSTVEVRMKKIMESPLDYRQFYKRFGIFPGWNLIFITADSDFYFGIGDDYCRKTVPMNVIYYINKRKRTIESVHFNPSKEEVIP